MAKIIPLFSGSSGNSIYIGSGGGGILVDAGRSAKQLENALGAHSLSPNSIQAIFVTHEHSDHVQGLRVLASRHHLPVYSSWGTLEALNEMGILNGKFPCEALTEEGIVAAGMYIKPFRTSHDSRESVGYIIHTSDGRRVVVATDLGFMSGVVRDSIRGCDAVVLESNHDLHMLQNGSYPYYLKRRILSDTGHLSNDACAEELPDFIRSGTTCFILAHLSRENNFPELAYQTAVCRLTNDGMKAGVDYRISVAPMENLSGNVILL
jgi:phosphoribosyl 1,2-cyclic phosphodiesterase